MSSLKPLSEREVAFKAEDGTEYKCRFQDIDTLLYQWKRGYFPLQTSPGKYIAEQLRWTRPLTDGEVLSFSNQVDRIRAEVHQEFRSEVEKKAPPDVRFSSPAPEPKSVPVTNGRLSPSDLIDIACMVAFILRLDPELGEWGLKMMQAAGCSRDEMEVAVRRLEATRRR